MVFSILELRELARKAEAELGAEVHRFVDYVEREFHLKGATISGSDPVLSTDTASASVGAVTGAGVGGDGSGSVGDNDSGARTEAGVLAGGGYAPAIGAAGQHPVHDGIAAMNADASVDGGAAGGSLSQDAAQAE